jgi:energy-coupling factor transporter transmembrane protein EcfT
MKNIKKLLNPLNPILPAFLLLIAFLWFGYSDFVKEKYTEEEKMIFEEGIKFTDELSSLYKIKWCFTKHDNNLLIIN